MPEALLDSRSEFDRAKVVLGSFLRSNARSVRPLNADELSRYSDYRFVAGWSLAVAHGEVVDSFEILLGREFPYSPIRVAYKTKDVYLRWPHVEPAGLLCLPLAPAPHSDLEQAAITALSDAVALVEQCRDPTFVENELIHEFLSYWNRSEDKETERIRSLLDTTNRRSRRIAVWLGEQFTLVGETAGELKSWLANRGRTEESSIKTGLFAFLDQAPIPPFPRHPRELFALLGVHSSGALQVLSELSIVDDVTVVLAAGSPSGDAQIGFEISRPKSFRGFRKSNQLRSAAKQALWGMQSELKRISVDRFDAAWVHGRGFNTNLPTLRATRVLVLGCGSVGSQVASRLAQAGVGTLVLVDPDTLSAANVGRHALGMQSVKTSKATALAETLRRRFPHALEIKGYPLSWQSLYRDRSDIFEEATLILACIGEWGPDGQLGEWQARRRISQPIVFGWLDEFGVASHALALTRGSPALSCVLNPGGLLRVPETLWKGDGRVQAEPACGTLFQPYGPIDVAQAEILISRLCIDLLTAKAMAPCHRIQAGSTAQLNEAGGEWSPAHLQSRPVGFTGAFEYERPVTRCGQCHSCQMMQS